MTRPAFTTAVCARFFDHWDTLRGDKPVPSLRDFLSRVDPDLQPHMIIIDVASADMLRVRLFATRLVDLAGIDLTGGNLFLFVKNAQMAAQLWHAAQAVTGHPCGLWSNKLAVTSSGRQITVEMMSLPLLPFDGGAPVIACAVEVIEKVDFRERVFGLVRYVNAGWVDVGHGVPAAALSAIR